MVRERARVVFGPWLERAPISAPPKARFFVEADDGGRWRVGRTGSPPTTASDSLDRALSTVEYGAVACLLEPDSGVVALHAALLSRNGRGVLLAGPKEAGKSTLACALWRAGWSLHSDDNALIEEGTVARGMPRRVSLRETSRNLVGSELWDRILALPGTTRTRTGAIFHPGEASPVQVPEAVPVTAVVFLARRGADVPPAGLEELDAGRSLIALAPYCNRRDAGIGRALEALQPLADRAPVYDLGRGDLTVMIERVEEVVAT
jgi:hypothetical protein